MFRFKIRDPLWLTVVVALTVGWWLDHRRLASENGTLGACYVGDLVIPIGPVPPTPPPQTGPSVQKLVGDVQYFTPAPERISRPPSEAGRPAIRIGHMAVRFKLRFGLYRVSKVRLDQRVDCECAGTVRVVAISDAPVQWPLGVVRGHRIPVLCGDQVRAVQREAACDVAAAWVSATASLPNWRKALRVRRTVGGRQRLAEGVWAADPARDRKIATTKLGKLRPRHVIEAMRRMHVGKSLPASTRGKMSAAHRRRCTRPPWLNPSRQPWEDEVFRKFAGP
jgi:hypothetical protein